MHAFFRCIKIGEVQPKRFDKRLIFFFFFHWLQHNKKRQLVLSNYSSFSPFSLRTPTLSINYFFCSNYSSFIKPDAPSITSVAKTVYWRSWQYLEKIACVFWSNKNNWYRGVNVIIRIGSLTLSADHFNWSETYVFVFKKQYGIKSQLIRDVNLKASLRILS